MADLMRHNNHSKDPNMSARYAEELKKIDYYLGVLISYICDNYSNDEVLVSRT
jgi:hypothetical protein